MPDGSRTSGSPTSAPLRRVTDLYRAHVRYVARVLQRCGVPAADLDDAVQETFVVVYRRMQEFDGRAAERTWLYAIATRVASTMRRTRRREQARRDKAGDDVHGSAMPNPEDELTRAQAARVLDGLLAQLDDNKRTVFVLAELEGIKAAEISRILGLNVRTVHSRLRLARAGMESAMQRFHARERGRDRLRTLARQAEPERRPTRAACAALLIRIERGDAPLLTGWEQLTLAPAAKASLWAPLVATLALGGSGLAVVAVAAQDDSATVPTAEAPTAKVPTRTAPSAPQTAAPVAGRTVATPIAATAPSEPTAVAHRPVEPSRPSPRAPRATAPSPAPTDGLAEPSGFDAEVALMERARLALRNGDPTSALSALADHAKAFPAGQLKTERVHTRIKALCLAGRGDDARALAGPNINTAAYRVWSRACAD